MDSNNKDSVFESAREDPMGREVLWKILQIKAFECGYRSVLPGKETFKLWLQIPGLTHQDCDDWNMILGLKKYE